MPLIVDWENTEASKNPYLKKRLSELGLIVAILLMKIRHVSYDEMYLESLEMMAKDVESISKLCYKHKLIDSSFENIKNIMKGFIGVKVTRSISKE